MSVTTSAIERSHVIKALQRVEQGERDSLEDLRQALCSFVGALRAEGVEKDAAIRAVADLIMTPASPEGDSNLRPPAREALIELSTHWCAEEFKRG